MMSAERARKGSFADYLKDAPLVTDTSAKLVLVGEVKRSTAEGKFVFISPEVGTVELNIDAVSDFERLDDGRIRMTMEASQGCRLLLLSPQPAGAAAGATPFVMAIPHHASAESIRMQLNNAGMTAAIMDVETAFMKDVWGDGIKKPPEVIKPEFF